MTEFDMTKKDFVLISKTIGRLNLPRDIRTLIAIEFGNVLRSTNDRFSFMTFIAACNKEIDNHLHNHLTGDYYDRSEL